MELDLHRIKHEVKLTTEYRPIWELLHNILIISL